MQKLPFLLLLLGLLGCGIVGELADEADYQIQACMPTRGKSLPILRQHPSPDATDVDPSSVVFVEIDAGQVELRNLGIMPSDASNPNWHYVTGSSFAGRVFTYPNRTGYPISDALNKVLVDGSFDEIIKLRAFDQFSPNSEITIEVNANCYKPYTFSFTTGDG